jgi:hypothetical protein
LLKPGLRLWLVLACMLALAGPARAAAPVTTAQITGKRVALVIGNSQYRNVDRLPNPANDARLIATTLQALGFTLVGGGAQLNLDRAQMTQAVQDFGRALAGADVGLFYYSGHGLQVQGVNWLVPVDANPARPQDLDFQMVDTDLVLRQMDGAGTKLNLMLLDACRNNPFASRGLRSAQGGLAEMRAPEGTLISYATQPGNVATDGEGANSPYTAALAGSMQQPGLDIFRLFNQVGLQVKRSTGGSQQPWVSSSPIDGEFYFAGFAPPLPAPAPAAPPPAPPPAPAPPAVAQADPLERVRIMASERRCSVLEARTVDRRVEISGLTLPGADWDSFLRQIQATRGVSFGLPSVTFLPEFACDAVDVVAPLVRRSREAAGGPLLRLPRSTFSDRMTLTLLGSSGNHVLFDLYRPDGTVVHHSYRPAPDADARRSFPLEGAPDGPRLLVAMISARKLDALASRPKVEPTGPYLDALRQALQAGPPPQADIALFEQRGAAQPVNVASPAPPPPPPIRSPAQAQAPRPPQGTRCAAIMERAQLGDSVSDSDRAYLRVQCR